ncbi:hypothetical protein F5148DRAFT_372816 [Russula earlei]|uniref:Uncharacterized protein n=1 Tax=Russula earlei TaxID=71964 RepID=A0ACC0U1R5_9AGAM|nr:hypothetical protein F5148DRAFT_372816 [Russula earlei]
MAFRGHISPTHGAKGPVLAVPLMARISLTSFHLLKCAARFSKVTTVLLCSSSVHALASRMMVSGLFLACATSSYNPRHETCVVNVSSHNRTTVGEVYKSFDPTYVMYSTAIGTSVPGGSSGLASLARPKELYRWSHWSYTEAVHTCSTIQGHETEGRQQQKLPSGASQIRECTVPGAERHLWRRAQQPQERKRRDYRTSLPCARFSAAAPGKRRWLVVRTTSFIHGKPECPRCIS